MRSKTVARWSFVRFMQKMEGRRVALLGGALRSGRLIAFAYLFTACGTDAHSRPESVATSSARVSSSDAGTTPPPAATVGSLTVPAGGGNLSLAIYDASGQLVRTLIEAAPTAAGSIDVAWDGHDDFQNTLPAGTYSWKALISQATAVDEGSIGQGSSPGYDVSAYSSNVETVAVDPSGNVYEASPWEEFHQELRSWTSDGQRRWGAAIGGLGAALAADDAYVYVTQDVSGENRILRYSSTFSADANNPSPVLWSGQPTTGYIVANTSGGNGVFGLAVDSATLWVSNHAQSMIQAFDKASGAPLGQIAVADPHGIAADGTGNVWVTNGTELATLYSPSGATIAQISGLSQPFAAAIGGSSGHLFVGEAGTGMVKEFDPSTLTLVRGLFGRAIPGPVRDDRLRWPDTVFPECPASACASGPAGALAIDRTGRIVVGDMGNHRVQTYAPDGSLVLSRFNGYANGAQVDPNVNPNLVMSGGLEYAVDMTSGPTYGTWSLANNWTPSTTGASSHPAVPLLHRKLSNGREYTYAFSGYNIVVYQIAADGQSARESAIIGNDANGLYNGADTDASGTIDSGETVAKAGTASYTAYAPGLWVDSAGNIFIANGVSNGIGGALLELPLEGFDASANPLYSWDDVTTKPPLVAPDSTFWHFAPANVRLDPVNGDIYRIGTTSQASKSIFWMGGSTVERRTVSGSRSLFYIRSSTSDPNFVCSPGCVAAIATDTDGNFFYTGQSGAEAPSGAGQVWIKMFTTDGLMVAAAGVGATDGSNTGWIDNGLGLTAFARNGVHYVYSEDSVFGRSIRFRIDGVGTLQRLNDPVAGTPFTWSPPGPTQVVTVAATVADTVEGTTTSPGLFTFSRSDSEGDLTVSFTTAGTATPGTDYTGLSGTVHFANGSFTAPLEIDPLVDNVADGPETVVLTIAPGDGYASGTPSTATVTIHDRTFVTVSAAPSTVNVEGPSATFTIARDNTDMQLAVPYSIGPPRVPIASSTASSSYYPTSGPSATYDEQTSTIWMTAGNSDHEGHDDTPSITYTFDHVYTVGRMRVSNYNTGESQRAAKDVEILVSTDGTNYTSLGTEQLQAGVVSGATALWQEIDLGGVSAVSVKLAVKTNWYGMTFYQGKSYEGPYANRSITGLSEVQFYAAGADPTDIQPVAGNTVTGHFSAGSVTLAAGQASATVTVTPVDKGLVNQPPKALELHVAATGTYSWGNPPAASVSIVDDHVGPVVTVTSGPSRAVRGGSPGVFTFSRSGSTTGDLSISYTTATVPVPIVSSGASSSYNAGTIPAVTYDGRPDTFWMTAGNSDHEGHDDTPWITYTFDHVYTVGRMRVSNYNTGEYPRGAKDVEVFVSTDGTTFTSLGVRQLQEGVADASAVKWQDVDLGDVPALTVKLAVRDNWYGRTFYQGTSYEGAFANASITGLSEVQFFTGSTAPASDFAAGTLTGNVVIPDGQASVDLDVAALSTSTVGDTLTLTVTSDNKVYSVGTPNNATVSVVEEEHAVPVPIVSSLASSTYYPFAGPPVTYDGSLTTYWMTAGNSDHEGKDDTPWIEWVFDAVHPIGTMHVSNYNTGEYMRGAKDIEVFVSTDGSTFTSIGTRHLQVGSSDASGAAWQDVDLGGALALAVKIAIHTNWYGFTFYQGKSYEGAFANGSITGLSEVQFFAALPIVSSSASSTYYPSAPPPVTYDGNLATYWMTAGNSDHEGHDDTPWVAYTFDRVHSIGTMRVSNYNTGEYYRGAKTVELFVSTDGSTFSSIGTRQFALGASDAADATWQSFDLGGVSALAVKIVIRTNWYGMTFYQGTSYEGAFANRSITGLSEIQFYSPE